MLHDLVATSTVIGFLVNPAPTRDGYEELLDAQRQLLLVWLCLKRPVGCSSDAARVLIELAWSSAPALAIVPLQDVLNLGTEARMNVPGRAEANWRCPENTSSPPEIVWLRELTKLRPRTAEAVLGPAQMLVGTP